MKTNNPIFKGASGRLGDLCFRTVRGQTYIVRRPERRTTLSKGQQAVVSKFQAASQYAKSQTEMPEVRKLYETGISDKKRTAHLVALTDYMTPPTVHNIKTTGYKGKCGNKIIITATDDFMVTAVKVAIMGKDGAPIESGDAEAVVNHPDRWRYITTRDNPSLAGTIIQAIAHDRPGNTGTLEKVL